MRRDRSPGARDVVVGIRRRRDDETSEAPHDVHPTPQGGSSTRVELHFDLSGTFGPSESSDDGTTLESVGTNRHVKGVV